jgi:RimJ/RimL family protein N-acetyltransferase
MRAVAEHAFDLGFEAVAADVFDFNRQGIRVLEKLGFRRISVTAEYVVKRGRPVDGVRYRVTRNELIAQS